MEYILPKWLFLKTNILILILLIFSGCSRFYRKPVTASFSLITEAQPGETWYPQRTTESTDNKSFPVKQFHCDLTQKEGNLNLYFSQPGGFLEFTPVSAGLPADWAGYSKLQLDFENSGNKAVNLILSLKGVRGILTDTVTIGPSEKTRFDMEITDLPLTAGIHPPYQPQYIQISCTEHNTALIIHTAKLKDGNFFLKRFRQKKVRALMRGQAMKMPVFIAGMSSGNIPIWMNGGKQHSSVWIAGATIPLATGRRIRWLCRRNFRLPGRFGPLKTKN